MGGAGAAARRVLLCSHVLVCVYVCVCGGGGGAGPGADVEQVLRRGVRVPLLGACGVRCGVVLWCGVALWACSVRKCSFCYYCVCCLFVCLFVVIFGLLWVDGGGGARRTRTCAFSQVKSDTGESTWENPYIEQLVTLLGGARLPPPEEEEGEAPTMGARAARRVPGRALRITSASFVLVGAVLIDWFVRSAPAAGRARGGFGRIWVDSHMVLFDSTWVNHVVSLDLVSLDGSVIYFD